MELEQLLKPREESILGVAFIHGLREEFKSAAQLFSIGVVDVHTVADVVRHVRDSMLIVATHADTIVLVIVLAFPAGTALTPAHKAVTQDAIVAQLFTLSTQTKFLTESIATVVAIGPRLGNIVEVMAVTQLSALTATNEATHMEADCFTRQRGFKQKADARTPTETVGVATSSPLPPCSPFRPRFWCPFSYVAKPCSRTTGVS
jgi:hypothetical protein